MEINSSLNQNVDTLFSNLESFTQNEGVMGKPVTYGDKTFIPVVTLTLGYGGGNTANKAPQNNTGATQGAAAGLANMGVDALGLGARISTEAIVLIDKDNVSIMPLTTTGNMSQMMNKIPQMFMGNKQQQGQQQGQQEGQCPQQGQQ